MSELPELSRWRAEGNLVRADDVLIGTMETAALAQIVVEDHNEEVLHRQRVTYITPGEMCITAAQIREFQDSLNLVLSEWGEYAIVLPPGSRVFRE